MKAENRLLSDWFDMIRTGEIRLPRFQRYEVWGHGQISGLLETVFRGLPAGATLMLDVGAKEQFPGRLMSGAPEPTQACSEHLLDGQQRLTALWKCVNDLYDDRTYFVYFKPDEDHDGREIPWIYGQARWWKSGVQNPVWCDDPAEVHKRDYIPVSLMRKDEHILPKIRKWCEVAAEKDLEASRRLEDRVLGLRDLMLRFNIPYLSMPSTTPPDVALDVFIKLNTTSVKLSAFDIIVAKFESETGQSLRELADQLHEEVPEAARYAEPEELILNVAALRDGYAPTQANYQKLDLRRLEQEWPELVAGVKWAIEWLEAECVFDSARLPTVVVLPVLAALYADETKAMKSGGPSSELVRKYIWRAFMTRRYENSVSTRSLQDLRGLRHAIAGHDIKTDAPIFDEEQFPLPALEELMLAGWPKNRDILARGLLTIALKAGARDVIENEAVTAGHVKLRNYHHLFPFPLLTGEGQMPGSETYRALNCALLTWETVRIFSAGEPQEYFKSGARKGRLVAQEIRDRLASHLIPVEQLEVGGYDRIKDPDDRAEKIRVDYQTFLRARAELMYAAMTQLCDGKAWPDEGGAQVVQKLRNAG